MITAGAATRPHGWLLMVKHCGADCVATNLDDYDRVRRAMAGWPF